MSFSSLQFPRMSHANDLPALALSAAYRHADHAPCKSSDNNTWYDYKSARLLIHLSEFSNTLLRRRSCAEPLRVAKTRPRLNMCCVHSHLCSFTLVNPYRRSIVFRVSMTKHDIRLPNRNWSREFYERYLELTRRRCWR